MTTDITAHSTDPPVFFARNSPPELSTYLPKSSSTPSKTYSTPLPSSPESLPRTFTSPSHRALSSSFDQDLRLLNDEHDHELETEDEEDASFEYLTSGVGNSLPLTPFSNQVGGHTPVLRFSERAICKPLDPMEQTFYELVEAMHPELQQYTCTYLGVVNVNYSTIHGEGPAGQEWWLEGTPVVLLEQNRHLLLDQPQIPYHERTASDPTGNSIASSTNSSDESINLFRINNRRLQQGELFREALSPKSLRARFAQLKSTVGAMKRRHSISGLKDADGSSSKLVLPTNENTTMPSTPTQKPKSIIATPPVIADRASSDSLTPIFQMDNDEADVKPDSTYKSRRKGHTRTNSYGATSTLGRQSYTPSPSSTSTPSKSEPELPPATNANMNPWSLQCYINVLKSPRQLDTPQKFLLLGDLTEGMKRPCILDLKMGRRQHGVRATLAKARSQEKKCERSTSKELGVRICGMQVWKTDSQTYMYLDKYAGRQINTTNFKSSLLGFLDSGDYYLVGHIPTLIAKLTKLHKIIQTLPHYRFYASSLLMIYDGAWLEESSSLPNKPREVDVRMIDFAHFVPKAHLLVSEQEPSTPPGCTRVPFPPTSKGADSGYSLGLSSLIGCLTEIYDDFTHGDGINTTTNSNTRTSFGHVRKETLSSRRRASVELGVKLVESDINMQIPSLEVEGLSST
ncbi:hypothetical protein SmJEL517_g05685 [Synchytrium microbalum]|uniref:Kinase n=1 Tax=Synchytrium microbalum TaxID=1806994 RepID=A0A507BUE6_9FUNG|nr:uncharacterized protein SmJEL517_g05685 [Synchytrium microbalum]TPX30841.1 hypothetical protein SmJEL517_g05685 [Synchytrium microbalum]